MSGNGHRNMFYLIYLNFIFYFGHCFSRATDTQIYFLYILDHLCISRGPLFIIEYLFIVDDCNGTIGVLEFPNAIIYLVIISLKYSIANRLLIHTYCIDNIACIES